MSKQMIIATTCDLCNYGGPYSRPEDFRTIDGYDFCRWCADDRPRQGRLECGRHVVTITEDNWSCVCGATYASVMPPFRYGPVWDAVPSPLNATANFHVNS